MCLFFLKTVDKVSIIMSEPAQINLFFFEDLFFKELGILGIRDFILFNLFSL